MVDYSIKIRDEDGDGFEKQNLAGSNFLSVIVFFNNFFSVNVSASHIGASCRLFQKL